MKTTTWINASALLAAVTIALGVANWDTGAAGTALSPGLAPAESFMADVATGWLPAEAARSEIEQRSALLQSFAAEHRITVRVLDSSAAVRTRNADGERLGVPLARLTRSFEFRVTDARDGDLLRGTLATWSVPLHDARAATPQRAATAAARIDGF